MRILIFLCLLCVSLTWAIPAEGGVIDDLFHASVEIDDQSTVQQQKAVKQAFSQVLVKVSGNRSLLADEKIKKQITRAKDFLLSYRFSIDKDKITYHAEFDVQKVENIIRTVGFPIWGKRRPETLIWLAVEQQQGGKRKLVAADSFPALVEQSKHIAQQRGITVSFPVLDLIDIQKISVYDVWSSYTQSLLVASERYGAEYMVAARLFYRSESAHPTSSKAEQADTNPDVANVWVLEWTMSRKDDFSSGEVIGLTQAVAIENLIETLADRLADKYSISAVSDGVNGNSTELKISQVDSLSAYTEVLSFLSSLSVVTSAELIEIQGDVATFKLKLFGNMDNLKEALLLEDRIETPQDNSTQQINEKPYRWKR
ncbi:DUF2066 domain-containing protein [Aliiglaciecola sp. LCG003]|uniref:DUF2066 domain-containing protein n=1 Tax=Aliiglaciecola sp. LCG003 TaxID=3053655 RepID=UPI0025724ED3|nr:DUF2066 domain-containing protein [Aliiglaciecola sp. LCG003]WJG11140.1 DUF2066 domain-containing protein [Aliiglaciecola sp. LCG003]